MSDSSAVAVYTRTYVASHGKPPRGRGTWGFFIGNPHTLFWAPDDLAYEDALKLAVAEAQRIGADYILVAP